MAFNYRSEAGAVAAAGSEGLFTALQYFADNPQGRKQLYEKHGYKKSFYMMLKEMGLGSGVKGPQYFHYETGWIKNTFVVGTVTTASGGANTPVIFSLKAESMLSKTIEGSTVRFSYPLEGDIIEMPTDRTKKAIVTFKDTSTNPHRLTVKPMSNYDLATYVVADARFFIAGNAHGEGQLGVKSRLTLEDRISNQTQIFKEAYGETGSSLTNELPFEFYQKDGKNLGYLLKGSDDAQKRLYDDISMGLLTGIYSNFVTQTDEGGLTGYDPYRKTTQGAIDFAVEQGTEISHTIGSLDVSSFDVVSDIMKQERVPGNQIAGFMGNGYRREVENSMLDFFMRDLGTFAGKFKPESLAGSNPNDFFAWLGFSGVYKNGYYTLFNSLDEFDDPQGMGATGYQYTNSALWMPLATIKNKGDKRDVSSIGYRYKELNGYNREMEIIKTGGVSVITETSTLDGMKIDFRSDIGGEWALGNAWVWDQGETA